jgi:23S rRNA (cytosine1962-C5)-methyltransferase
MSSEKFLMFKNRLLKVFKHRNKIAERQQIFCFRIYDHDLPEFPIMVDKYANNLYIAEYQRNYEGHEDEVNYWWEQVLAILTEVTLVPEENIFIKKRQRKTSRQDQYKKLNSEKDNFVVAEDGLKFYINLKDYLDTGLFLDHRITRKEVRGLATNKNVLNLFAYTGSFSVYAKAGGANLVTTVDLSNTYCNWAIENLKLNNFYSEQDTPVIKTDVLQWLANNPTPNYDIIICDPPTFSNSKSMAQDFFDVQLHHEALLLQCAKWLKPKGLIYFSNNYTKFSISQNLNKSFAVKDITSRTTPFDFEKKLKRSCFLLQIN